MRAVKIRTFDSKADGQTLFDVVLGVVQNEKYTLSGLDNAHRTIAFVSGKTALSWGQEFLGEITPSGSGASLRIACGSHDDARKALMDGWKGGKAADQFIAKVTAVLEGTTTAPATPTESFVTTKDGIQPI